MTHAKIPEQMLPTQTTEEVSTLRRLFCDLTAFFTSPIAAPTETGDVIAQTVVRFRAGQARSLSIQLDQALADGETATLYVYRVREGTAVTMLTTASKAVTATADLTAFLSSAVPLLENDVIQIKLAYSAGATPTPLTSGHVRLQAQ